MTRQKLGLHVDPRTQHMSDEALKCRRLGHKWELRGMSRKRFQELVRLRQMEDIRYCENGCGGTWRQLWDIRNGQILENERTYPKGGEYLLPPNSGRLHRDDARVAQFARQHSAYV